MVLRRRASASARPAPCRRRFELRASDVTVVLRRSEKVNRRKGKRVSIVGVVSLSRGVRCRSSSGTGGWGWSQFET